MTNNDIVILKHVNEYGSMSDIGSYRQFDITADFRLENLEKLGYIQKHIKGNDSSYAGDYEITGKGLAFLVDYTEGRKRSFFTFIIANLILPTVIAFLTSLLMSCIK